MGLSSAFRLAVASTTYDTDVSSHSPAENYTQLPPSGEAAAVVAVAVFRHYHEEKKKNIISKD